MSGDTEQQAPGLDWDAASRKMIEQASEGRGTPPGSDAELIADLQRRLAVALKELGATRQEHADIAKFGVQVMLNDLRDQLAYARAELASSQHCYKLLAEHAEQQAAELAAAQEHSRLLDDQLQRTQGYAADMAGEIAALKQRIACRFSHDEVDGLIAKATAALKQRLAQVPIKVAACAGPVWDELPVKQREEIRRQDLYELAHATGVLAAVRAAIDALAAEPPGGQQEQGNG